MKTRKQVILSALKRRTRRGITSKEAFEDYGISRLSDVIYDLRQDGHEIDSNMVEVKTRYGKTRISQYILVKEAE